MENQPVDLTNIKSIAFVASDRLGDCLISMIVSYNLRRNGFKVTTFSNYLSAIKNYFPEEDIQPYPSEENAREILSQYDLLIYMANHNIRYQSDQWHPKNVILDNYQLYRRSISMVEIQLAVCREVFGLTDIVRTNGFKAPANLQYRGHSQRVVIHPSASSPLREWPANRFIKLAQQLSKQGFEPVFVFAPKEKDRFSWVVEHHLSYVCDPRMDFLPQFIYESGWFIGNDSGVGHLASNLGIPTLTLLARKSLQRRWMPGWAPAEGLLPPVPLLFRSWKMRYWKYFISVSKVLKTFLGLVARCPCKTA